MSLRPALPPATSGEGKKGRAPFCHPGYYMADKEGQDQLCYSHIIRAGSPMPLKQGQLYYATQARCRARHWIFFLDIEFLKQFIYLFYLCVVCVCTRACMHTRVYAYTHVHTGIHVPGKFMTWPSYRSQIRAFRTWFSLSTMLRHHLSCVCYCINFGPIHLFLPSISKW